MKLKVLSLLFLLPAVVCYASENKLDGFYGCHTGYVGEIVELKNGQFRYWWSSDKVWANMPTYPFKGNYSFEGKSIFLNHPGLRAKRWTPKKINGHDFLVEKQSPVPMDLLRFVPKTPDDPWNDSPHYSEIEKIKNAESPVLK